MVSILDYPEKDSLLDRILESFNVAKEATAEEHEEQEQEILNIEPERVLFTGPFANDEAELGENQFQISILVEVPGFLPLSDRRLNEIQEATVQSIQPSETMAEWSAGVSLDVFEAEDLSSFIRAMLRDEDDMAYDMLNDTILELEQTDIGTLEVIERPREDKEPEEPETEPDQETEEEEEERVQFEHLPPELRPYGTGDSNVVDIPINKDSHQVEARPLYDFEIEMMTPGDANTGLQGTINDGIGGAIERQSLGQKNAEGEFNPPSSFPRTGSYIKYHLFFRGPSYIMEMYRDIVVYSGYISTTYNGRYEVGAYSSFREHIYRLTQVAERDLGPPLIRKISPEEAVERGLDTVPELPSGDDAPWLIDRQYYEVIEDNMNHPAWDNISEFIYGEIEQ